MNIKASCSARVAGLIVLAASALAAGKLEAQDSWDSLPEVPFTYGVSSGGGLATDGTYLYAADFSGDANDDFIDLDRDGSPSAGETLAELGIANGSVRMARYDPATETWAGLPTLNEAGVGGDGFSSGNLNGSLFHIDGFLYYYQFRAGPNRCVLYRYDLDDGLAGSWTEVWDLGTAQAHIGVNAGVAAASGPDGPVIFHHKGGGEYRFSRSTGLDGVAAESHVQLTPDWPYGNAHFPRNGAWAYDPIAGRIYHMSGNQLLQWEPSPVYAPADFRDAVPQFGDDLALFSVAISSLRNTFPWEPGGAETHPGTSLWGNDLVVVNDPSGHPGGPTGEDTGANVLYLVRGETTSDPWPFNEGRGRINNGDFARYFPGTGNAQALPAAPFHVGKGASACYLNGYLYLLQGETDHSYDGWGPYLPISGDGIRIPGHGFARFAIRPPTVTGSPVIPVQSYLAGGFASLTASADNGTGTEPLFDGDWDSIYTADAENPAVILVEFSSPTESGAARALFGNDNYTWTLDAADSEADLLSGGGSYAAIFSVEAVAPGDVAWMEWNATPVSRKIYRFTVANTGGGPVEIHELELQRPKPVFTVEINGSPVDINHLAISPSDSFALLGDEPAFTAEASLSLGPDRYDVTMEATWSSSETGVALIDPTGRAQAVGTGGTVLQAAFSGLIAETSLTVGEAGPRDDDLDVALIRRLPEMDFVWDSSQPGIDGWPAAGSGVVWRAMVKNWYPLPREDVGYRWNLDGTVVASGTVDLAPSGYTAVDLPRTWSFDRRELLFEIDPANEIPEVSEANNTVSVFTDSISVGFWVEQLLYDYFHTYQHELGIGSNSWEDWAQRQVGFWNRMFEEAVHPVDAPDGVLDRIRIDKITVVPDGALPLEGGSYPSNYPDTSDRTVDLMWGFPATLVGHGMYANHTDPVPTNFFYYEGSLIHELGHARYLIDGYGFNIVDRASDPRVLITHGGGLVAGTPYLPREWKWWDHVHIIRPGVDNPFDGLMASDYTFVDRYSAAALNRIAGHRATKGNYNAPGNIGVFINDLPAENTVQFFDGKGQPIPDPTVTVYRATGYAGDWYGKQFDDTPDLTFTGDANGCVEVGRNPFADGNLQHGYGLSNMTAILKVESGDRTGFCVLEAGLFNMEYWRGHTEHGYYALTVPMIGPERDVVYVHVWSHGGDWRVQIIASGDIQPDTVTIGDAPAAYDDGSWWAMPGGGEAPRLLTATWPGGPEINRWIHLPAKRLLPSLAADRAGAPTGSFLLQWIGRAGDAYDLEWSDDLSTWEPVPGLRRFGHGEDESMEVPYAGPGDFYRMQVVPLGH